MATTARLSDVMATGTFNVNIVVEIEALKDGMAKGKPTDAAVLSAEGLNAHELESLLVNLSKAFDSDSEK